MPLKARTLLFAMALAAPAFALSEGRPIPPGTDVRYVSQSKVDFDEVGYAGRAENMVGVMGATSRLPPDSFAEVTDLASGRTILVRIMPSALEGLIWLSDGARNQLGAADGKLAVRVRRTNPPQHERTALSSGGPATERLATPPALLNALRKQLAGAKPVSSVAEPAASKAEPKAEPRKLVAPVKVVAVTPAPETWFVQIAALSNEGRARALAKSIGGSVQAAGAVWRIRAGPYPNEAEARRALGALKANGYRDARIAR